VLVCTYLFFSAHHLVHHHHQPQNKKNPFLYSQANENKGIGYVRKPFSMLLDHDDHVVLCYTLHVSSWHMLMMDTHSHVHVIFFMLVMVRNEL